MRKTGSVDGADTVACERLCSVLAVAFRATARRRKSMPFQKHGLHLCSLITNQALQGRPCLSKMAFLYSEGVHLQIGKGHHG